MPRFMGVRRALRHTRHLELDIGPDRPLRRHRSGERPKDGVEVGRVDQQLSQRIHPGYVGDAGVTPPQFA
eukprot:3723379-Prymnesium_polylepis.1